MKGSCKFIAMRHQWGWPAKSQARKVNFFNYFFEAKKRRAVSPKPIWPSQAD
jgi:hypothetical protein